MQRSIPCEFDPLTECFCVCTLGCFYSQKTVNPGGTGICPVLTGT